MPDRRTLSVSIGLTRPLAVAAGTVLGLRAAYSLAPQLGTWLVPLRLARVTEDVIWPPEPLLHQFTTYVAALALAILGAVLVSALGRLAERKPHGAVALAAGVALLDLVLAVLIAPFTGLLAAALLVAITVLAAPTVDPAPNEPSAAVRMPLFALFAELVVLTWGLALVFAERPRVALGSWALLSLAYGARLWPLRKSTDMRAVLERDAAAAVPVLLLPLVALLRAPSPAWVLLALVAAAVLRRFVFGARAPGRGFDAFAASVATAALASVWFIPAQFRELDSINYTHHEAQHLGWLASALRGKWLMADASLFYGPLREYAMAGWLRIAGVTLEQARVSAVLLNVLGTGVLAAVAYRLVRGRSALLLFAGFLLLTQSPLRYFVAYRTHTAFGWADVMRVAFSVGALLVLDFGLERTVPGGRIARHDRRTFALFGGFNALAFFYSQEFGLCALAAAPLALLLDALARAKGSRFRDAVGSGCRRAASYLAGFLLVFGLWVLAYGVAGKAVLLLRSLFMSVALPGSGAFGSLELPIHRDSFGSLAPLLAPYTDIPAGEFLFAPLVYVLTGALLVARVFWGRWDARARFQLGLLLFGAASYRFASARADGYHVSLATAPALLLLVSLLADALPYGVRVAGARIPFAACLGFLLAYGASRSYGATDLLLPRVRATLRGEEMPSRGPKYVYPKLPRAGDIRIPDETARAAEYIRAESLPQDFVFNRVSFMDGGELMFLANRRNPTRFDNLAELTWRPQQKELLAELRQNPPALVLGDTYGAPYLDAETLAHLAAGWQPGRTFGEVTIMKRSTER